MIRSILKKIFFKLISANKVAQISGVRYGSNCHFRTKRFGSEPYLIKVGDNFKTAGNVQFITHDGAVFVLRNLHDKYKNIDCFAPIIAGNNIFVGYGAILLPGTVIGDNVIIGAGSLVRGTLESDSVYSGVPVKYICSIEEYLDKNADRLVETKHLLSKDKRAVLEKTFSADLD
jgi:acetyltransferase-like isoleucine patch superfamily enzyme